MQAPAPQPTGPTVPRMRPPRAQGLALFAACALFLGCDIAAHPIVLWDESRVASNALEMSRTGFSLITTYGFRPDLWNTKPPLLVWLIAGSIDLFGASEWAVRLPSLIAALITVALVMVFTWRLTRSAATTGLASLLLVLSPGWFGAHVVQSGDYETLLTLFTTSYLLLLFAVIHKRLPKARWVLLFAVLVAGACLTKGIAGVIPGVGAALYVLVSGRWPRLFKTPWYAVGAVVTIALVGGFYLAREQALPGYLKAVMASELGGRYLHGMKGHVEPVYYYVEMLFALFAFGPALAALLVAPFLRWRRVKATAFLAFGGYVSLTMMVVLTISQTKIFWYLAPLYPVLAIMLAIILMRLLAMLPRGPRGQVQTAHLLATILVGYMVVNAVAEKAYFLPRAEDNPQGRYGLAFAQLARQGVTQVRTFDGGVANDDDLVNYTPQLHFYDLVWARKGLVARRGDPDRIQGLAKGEVAVTCDERYLDAVAGVGAPMQTVEGCQAARVE